MTTTRVVLSSALTLALTATLTLATTTPTTPIFAVDKNKLAQCNSNQQLYVPFYRDNSDAALKATTSSFADENGIESTLNVAGAISRDCFSCDEIHQFINNERSNIINNHSSCTKDDDCVLNWANTGLRGGCQWAVNKDGDQELTQWVKKWNKWFGEGDAQQVGTDQVQFHHSTCGYMTPMCMLQHAQCRKGQCRATSKPDVDELVYTYPVDAEVNHNNHHEPTIIRL